MMQKKVRQSSSSTTLRSTRRSKSVLRPQNARFRSLVVSAHSILFPTSCSENLSGYTSQVMAFWTILIMSERTIIPIARRVIFFFLRPKKDKVCWWVSKTSRSWFKRIMRKSISYSWLPVIQTSSLTFGSSRVSVTSFQLTRKTLYRIMQPLCLLKHFIVWCSQAITQYARLLNGPKLQLRLRFHQKKPRNS